MDAEIIAHVACIVTLQDSWAACLTEPDHLLVDEDHDQTLDQEVKLQQALEKNIQARASASAEIIQSYEDIKAEKHFLNPLNIRHINKAPFTRLLRTGANICCFFQENLG